MIVTEYRLLVPDWIDQKDWRRISDEMRRLGGVYSAAARCKAWKMPGGFVFRTAEEAAFAAERLNGMTRPAGRGQP